MWTLWSLSISLAARFMTKDKDQLIREYLAEIGRKGGKARAKKHAKATLSKWARKGGRPPKRKGDGQ